MYHYNRQIDLWTVIDNNNCYKNRNVKVLANQITKKFNLIQKRTVSSVQPLLHTLHFLRFCVQVNTCLNNMWQKCNITFLIVNLIITFNNRLRHFYHVKYHHVRAVHPPTHMIFFHKKYYHHYAYLTHMSNQRIIIIIAIIIVTTKQTLI